MPSHLGNVRPKTNDVEFTPPTHRKRDAKAVIDFYDVDTLVPAASSL